MEKYLIRLTAIVMICFFSVSCTRDFERINTNQKALQYITGDQIDKFFTTAEYGGLMAWNYNGVYQVFNNLYGDEQSQFFSCTQQRFANDRNVMVGAWFNIVWTSFCEGASNLQIVQQSVGPKADRPDERREAIVKIWKVFMYLPITDSYGPTIYSQMGNGQDAVMYDTQEDIYNDFFKILTEANTVLSKNISGKVFPNGDVIFGGDVSKWIKFGNSLKLRCAMRISTKFPEKAKALAESAIAAPGGLMTENDANAFLPPVGPDFLNSLGFISEWGEFRMSAAMESVLLGYEDPRLPIFFSPAKATGVYKGIRNGLTAGQMALQNNNVDHNSNVGPRFLSANMDKEPRALMTAAETWFNLAECAVNGWNTGGKSAKECYDNGIKTSMAQWGVNPGLASSYISSTKTPKPLNDDYNTPSLSNIPVVFGTNESIQREQIATQKWLSLYPFCGLEAWAEFRRSGLPKLYSKLNNDNPDATVDAGSVKRLIFPPSEAIVNKEGFESALRALGGPDKTNTKLWWQK